MEINFRSTTEQIGEIIDCRCLIFAFEFYQLPTNSIEDLCTDVVRGVDNFLKDKFVRKQFDVFEKSITADKALKQLHDCIERTLPWSYRTEAFVLNTIVNNVKSMNKYMRTAEVVLAEKKLYLASRDYAEYWKKMFPNGRPDNESIRQNILRLFREENKKVMTGFGSPDVEASISIYPYKSDSQKYRGHFSMRIASYCLGDSLSDMAQKFAECGKYISERYVNVNARIMLQPIESSETSPYMRYFGNYDAKLDQSHLQTKCTDKEWYPTYYLPGVEWTNIISPLARKHIPQIDAQTKLPEGIAAKEMNGGGLLVSTTKKIDQYQVADALVMKQLLYAALYPGGSYMILSKLFQPTYFWWWESSLVTFPRNNWAIVPIFEEEIKIVSTYLVFSSKETKDQDAR